MPDEWSWKIARISGIELRVHATFLILLVWLALIYYQETGTVAGPAYGVLFTLALFCSVVLHELAHALMGRRFGVPTRDITLVPIGGVARLDHVPEQPWQELWIALAGPAVTVGIAVAIYVLLRVLGLPVALVEQAAAHGDRLRSCSEGEHDERGRRDGCESTGGRGIPLTLSGGRLTSSAANARLCSRRAYSEQSIRSRGRERRASERADPGVPSPRCTAARRRDRPSR